MRPILWQKLLTCWGGVSRELDRPVFSAMMADVYVEPYADSSFV
jgi:hypothetical protein